VSPQPPAEEHQPVQPAGPDGTTLPLFPLAAVLFPGLVMPLHVFEDRYRSLVRNLLDRASGEVRQFGVVAIRRGWEVDSGQSTVALYDVGCTAEIRKITEHPDGRFDLVTVGRRRFQIRSIVPAATPYLQADVAYLDDPAGPDAEADPLGPRVLAILRTYLNLLRTDGAENAEQLPEDPQVLSHLVAATAALSLADRQSLLAAPDTASRLRAELRLLHREIGLLRRVRAVPVTVGDLPVRPGHN
jgi:Lon protease-like protein